VVPAGLAALLAAHEALVSQQAGKLRASKEESADQQVTSREREREREREHSHDLTASVCGTVEEIPAESCVALHTGAGAPWPPATVFTRSSAPLAPPDALAVTSVSRGVVRFPGVMLRVAWLTLRARWVALRARWMALKSRWETLRAPWATLRARWVALQARWVILRARWLTFRCTWRGSRPRTTEAPT
jgi:hypothetical protein